MDTRTSHTSRTALLLGGLALVVAACGSGGGTSAPARLADASAPAGAGCAVVTTASVGGTTSLVSADGHTLYDAAGESPSHLRCLDACTGIWKPVVASARQAREAGAALGQRFTVVPRPDGGTQLVYSGHPLYVFAPEGAGELRGDGATDVFDGAHFTWSAATVGGSPHAQPRMGSKGTASPGGGGYGGGYGGY